MAKIQSPSGETEFFQITDIEKAFEKQLKTGEKVTVVPGVKEASFLREAPVRAEYTEAFKDFKDRLLNPYVPPTPPVKRCICLIAVRPWQFDFSLISERYIDNTASQFIGVRSESDQSIYPNLTSGLDFDEVTQGTTTDTPPGPYEYNFENTSVIGGRQFVGCNDVAVVLPDYLRMTGYVGVKNSDSDPLVNGWYSTSGIVIAEDYLFELKYVSTGGTILTYSPGYFNMNVPSSDTWPDIPTGQFNSTLDVWTLKADLYKPAGQCRYPTFQNFRFTNLYP
jgi:hypothetical protein